MDIIDEITTEEGFAFRFRLRPSTIITLPVPNETLVALENVAAEREMSVGALIKFYVGQGLRQDLAQCLLSRLWAPHLQLEEAVSAILKEIRVETAL